MILPIVAYGAPVLRKLAVDIQQDYPQLDKLLEDMWETMYYSSGVGLAAPQVNKNIRVFVIDTVQIVENMDEDDKKDHPGEVGLKRVFINPHVKKYDGEEWSYNEGCLSIPKIREDIMRPETIELEYLDENFQPHTESFQGITARVIQHEYDHLEGKLFIDYLKPLKRKMLQGKLTDISKGKVKVDYKMSFTK